MIPEYPIEKIMHPENYLEASELEAEEEKQALVEEGYASAKDWEESEDKE